MSQAGSALVPEVIRCRGVDIDTHRAGTTGTEAMPPQADVQEIYFLGDKPSAKQSGIVWSNLILFIIFHIGGVYGYYLYLFKIKWLTLLFYQCVGNTAALGVTAGAHRLWAHKAYKARLPLQILLLIWNTVSLNGPVIEWVRDHRMHHKYSETDADPHNATRGFFFSHIGWLLVRKHPEIKAKGHTIDVSDVMNDPLLRFQRRYYPILVPAACFIFPSYIPTLWGEPLLNAFLVCGVYRCIVVWHSTYLVNSWAHLWGSKPYDKYINPVETKVVSYLTLGEGYHNYHHTFPWDYKAAEGGGLFFNSTRLFIEFMAKIGWAYDLKSASTDVIRKRIERTGDGSHGNWRLSGKNIHEEDEHASVIVNPNKRIYH